jgi:hypothetical protein
MRKTIFICIAGFLSIFTANAHAEHTKKSLQQLLQACLIPLFLLLLSCDIRDDATYITAKNETGDTLCVYVAQDADIMLFDAGEKNIHYWNLGEMVPGQISYITAIYYSRKDIKVYATKKSKLDGLTYEDEVKATDFNYSHRYSFRELEDMDYYISIRDIQ